MELPGYASFLLLVREMVDPRKDSDDAGGADHRDQRTAQSDEPDAPTAAAETRWCSLSRSFALSHIAFSVAMN